MISTPPPFKKQLMLRTCWSAPQTDRQPSLERQCWCMWFTVYVMSVLCNIIKLLIITFYLYPLRYIIITSVSWYLQSLFRWPSYRDAHGSGEDRRMLSHLVTSRSRLLLLLLEYNIYIYTHCVCVANKMAVSWMWIDYWTAMRGSELHTTSPHQEEITNWKRESTKLRAR